MKQKKPREVLENVLISDYAAEGKSIARVDGKVIFVTGAVPGDVADLVFTKNKKDWGEALVTRIRQESPDRVSPFCPHFGTCGGCKWQMLPYELQLQYKQQEAAENLRRISKTDIPELQPIVGADTHTRYRNKLEFTFSNRRYLTRDEIGQHEHPVMENALGFHAPRLFDKVIGIDTCYLMDDINNAVRNTVRRLAEEKGFPYYDFREHSGWLRNLVVRYSSTGELMVNLVIHHEDEPNRRWLLDSLLEAVPEISTLLYTINPKWNDSLYDLEPVVYSGNGYITEKLEDFSFRISPKSFFQTNTKQAEKLYGVARDFAQLTGHEVLYDLYCGTGSIGIFMSRGASKIIGVETVDAAIQDARINASINGISHAQYFTGDVIKICTDAFFEEHGKPDVVITDPPRAGMHEKLVRKLLDMEAPRIVYVSCNTATMARDLGILAEKYKVDQVRPVDMFPHTHHIECVAGLSLSR